MDKKWSLKSKIFIIYQLNLSSRECLLNLLILDKWGRNDSLSLSYVSNIEKVGYAKSSYIIDWTWASPWFHSFFSDGRSSCHWKHIPLRGSMTWIKLYLLLIFSRTNQRIFFIQVYVPSLSMNLADLENTVFFDVLKLDRVTLPSFSKLISYLLGSGFTLREGFMKLSLGCFFLKEYFELLANLVMDSTFGSY